MGFDRRGFIQLAVGAVAGTLVTPIPWKLLDDASIWTQNWPWIPRLKYGAVEYKSTVSKMCPSGCGTKIKMVAGSPVVAQGNPDSPLSGGGLCPLCAAGVQMIHSPSRVKGPMKKTGEGQYQPISWDEAAKTLASKLSGLKGKDGKVVAVSGDESGTANEVFSGLLSEMGNSGFFLMPSEQTSAAQAWNKLMGGTGQVGYDLENADYVLLAGADALDSWGPTVRNQKAYGEGKAEWVYAGPVLNRTASGAGAYVPVSDGDMAAFLLGVASVLLERGAYSDALDFADFKALVMGSFSPAKVEKMTGIKAATIKKVAAGLASASRPLVVPGSSFGQGAGAAVNAAGIAVNLLLGNLNRSGGMPALSELPLVVESAEKRSDLLVKDFVGYLAKLEKGKVTTPEVLMVYEANPVYALPQADAFAQALDKVPFKVSFSTYMDETAVKADLILPAPHPLERLDDVQTPYGLGTVAYGVSVPVTKSDFDVKPTPDFLLGVAKALGIDLGYGSFEEILQAKAEKIGADWDSLTEEGTLWTSDSTQIPYSLSLGAGVLKSAAAPAKGGDLALAPLYQLNVGSPYIATPPHNIVTIPDYELKKDTMFVYVNAATAGKAGLADGKSVTLSGARGEIKAVVKIAETVMDGVVAAPLGFGHTAWDVFTKGKGANTNKILSVSTEAGSGAAVWAAGRVKVS